MFKSGYVSIVGKPNAGKSSLTNAMTGEKVAIVTHKPQTTRNNILGIKTEKDFQVVFVDTPGIHPSKNHLDRYMMKSVRSALSGVDLILYLIDSSKAVDDDEKKYINKLQDSQTNVLVVLTKCDKLKVADVDFDHQISIKKPETLQTLMEKVLDLLPQYEKETLLYDKDYYTDKSVKFLIKENIREQILKKLHKEIPHGVAVEIIKFEEKKEVVEILADIVCERDTHKGMIIGRGGSVLKKIGQDARIDCESLVGKKVFLKLFVKVEPDWRNKPNQITSLND